MCGFGEIVQFSPQFFVFRVNSFPFPKKWFVVMAVLTSKLGCSNNEEQSGHTEANTELAAVCFFNDK